MILAAPSSNYESFCWLLGWSIRSNAIIGEAEVSLQGRDLPSGVAGCFLVEPVCTVAIKMITENHEKLVGGRSIGCGCDGPVLDFRESFSSHIPSCVPEMLGANPK